MSKPSWKKFNVYTNLKRKKKQNVNKKKRKKPLRMKGQKMLKDKLEKTSKRNQLKKSNKARMTQPEVQNPNLIPTKAQNKKTLASWTTPPNTTSQASFRKRL